MTFTIRSMHTLYYSGIRFSSFQEMGKLDALKDKWWKEKGAGSCQGDGNGGDGKAGLPLANVGGVFVVLVGGK